MQTLGSLWGCRELALTWLAAGGKEAQGLAGKCVCAFGLALDRTLQMRRLGSDQVEFLWLRRPKRVLLDDAAAHDLGCESNMMMYVAAGEAANASQLRALGVQSRATGTLGDQLGHDSRVGSPLVCCPPHQRS